MICCSSFNEEDDKWLIDNHIANMAEFQLKGVEFTTSRCTPSHFIMVNFHITFTQKDSISFDVYRCTRQMQLGITNF